MLNTMLNEMRLKEKASTGDYFPFDLVSMFLPFSFRPLVIATHPPFSRIAKNRRKMVTKFQGKALPFRFTVSGKRERDREK
jgi:hypothetical protein